MRLTATFDNGQAEYTEAVLRVHSTYEKHGMSRPRWNEYNLKIGVQPHVGGLPDVWRFSPLSSVGKPDFVELTPDRQHYLLASAVAYYRGYPFASRDAYYYWWKNNTDKRYADWMTSACTKYRSHTNKLGLDNMRNDLKGERLDLGFAKFAQLVTGWAALKPLMENGKPRQRNVSGVGACYSFECINASSDYWQFNPIEHPHLFDVPMITGSETLNGYVIMDGKNPRRDNVHIPYPQFDGRFVFPIWLPLDSVGYISVTDAKLGKAGKAWIR